MSAKPTLFDVIEGTRQRDAGMERAAKNKAHLLDLAREAATHIARRTGEVNMDDVYAALEFYCGNYGELGNAAGAVFKGGQFEFTGRWVKSQRTTNHGRFIRVWKLK